MSRDEKLQIVSNVLNNKFVFHAIAQGLNVQLDTNDDFFHEVEEFILDNLERMDAEMIFDRFVDALDEVERHEFIKAKAERRL